MWFKIDDRLHEHRKVRNLKPASLGIWVLAGSWCGGNSPDGFVPTTVLRRWPGWKAAATELEAAGLWEPHATGTEEGWRFHDWERYNDPTELASTDDAAKLKAKRKRALRGLPDLRTTVHTRDGTLCRYCGVRVNFADRKSPAGGELDHIDPDGPNAEWNLVVACKRCNGQKRDRTPEEWVAEDGAWHETDNPTGGRLLRPEPIHDGSTTGSTPASLIGHGSTSVPLREAVPVTDRSRVGSGPGHGSGADLEEVGA